MCCIICYFIFSYYELLFYVHVILSYVLLHVIVMLFYFFICYSLLRYIYIFTDGSETENVNNHQERVIRTRRGSSLSCHPLEGPLTKINLTMYNADFSTIVSYTYDNKIFLKIHVFLLRSCLEKKIFLWCYDCCN